MNVRVFDERQPIPPSCKTVRLSRSDIRRGTLLLVNRDHPVRLPASDIEPVGRGIRGSAHAEEREIALERNCSRKLSALLEACGALDRIAVVSGYRSLESQRRLYEASLREYGEAFTASYVALPGASEHQTGLAVDVGLIGGEIDYIRPAFPDEGVCAVFRELAPRYGFVQRYREGKESRTGIASEPWHYRYVGYPHSVAMEHYGLCLEEYIEFVKRYAWGRTHLVVEGGESRAETYFVQATGDATEATVPSGADFFWSGNNADGFVVTVFYAKDGDRYA